MYSAYQILAYFIYYVIAGWCLEVVYAAFAYKKFVNRGFLSGPVCPIYGVGALIIVYTLSPFEHLVPGKPVLNLLLLFVCSVIVTTVLELVVGFILERFFHQKWWDYTDDPLNFKGIVCVPFSLIWGACCVALLKFIHPFVTFLISKIPYNAHIVIFCIFYSVFAFDLIFTIAELAKIGRSIRLASDLDRALNTISGLIGKPISTTTIFSLEQKDKLDKAARRLIAKAKEFYGEHYKDYKFKLSPVHRRIQKAYPDLHLTSTENVGSKVTRLSEFVDHIRAAIDKNQEKKKEKKERRAQAALEKKNSSFPEKGSKHRKKKASNNVEAAKYGKLATPKTTSSVASKPAKKGKNNKRKKQSR